MADVSSPKYSTSLSSKEKKSICNSSFSKGGSWVGGKTCSWLHNSTTARETIAHEHSWTSLGPWLLLFQVQSTRHHTLLSTPMEAFIPSKLWIPCGEWEASRLYKVFWEKQPPHLAGNQSLSLMPYHLPKDWSVQSGVCMKGCGRMGQGRESSAPQKGTHQQYKVSCTCRDLIFCHFFCKGGSNAVLGHNSQVGTCCCSSQ